MNAAVAYRDDKIVGIETMHEACPESAERWRARGDRVEILPVDEAIRRWEAGPIWRRGDDAA